MQVAEGMRPQHRSKSNWKLSSTTPRKPKKAKTKWRHYLQRKKRFFRVYMKRHHLRCMSRAISQESKKREANLRPFYPR